MSTQQHQLYLPERNAWTGSVSFCYPAAEGCLNPRSTYGHIRQFCQSHPEICLRRQTYMMLGLDRAEPKQPQDQFGPTILQRFACICQCKYSTMMIQQSPAASSRLDGNNPGWRLGSNAQQSCAPSSEAPVADPSSLDISAGLALFKSSAATGSVNVAPSNSAPSSAVERAKIRNKTAQSRFRARQKVGRRQHIYTSFAHVLHMSASPRRRSLLCAGSLRNLGSYVIADYYRAEANAEQTGTFGKKDPHAGDAGDCK